MTELTAGLKKQVGRSAPNLLTISRVVLACGVNSYLRSHFGEIGIPLFMFGLIFFTDYLDGKIARLAGTASSFGAVLDLTADFFFICLSYAVLHSFRLVPLWFIAVVFGKFFEFLLTSLYLKRLHEDSPAFIFDCLGRLVAAAFYLFPALLYVTSQAAPTIYTFCLSKLTYLLSFFALISSVSRIGRCRQAGQSRPLSGQDEESDQKEPQYNPVPAEGFEVIPFNIGQKETDGDHRNDKGRNHTRQQDGRLQPAEVETELEQLEKTGPKHDRNR